MCGIVGYIGKKELSSHDPLGIVVGGLKRLEYRGYDSAGISFWGGGEALEVVRAKGNIGNLEEALTKKKYKAMLPLAIGHTRWATHGVPTEQNAHPHFDEKREVMVVHNGIIENHEALRESLVTLGCSFGSSTDTEVIPHLIEHSLEHGTQDVREAVRGVLLRLEGSYAIASISTKFPGKLIVARRGSPLAIGIADDGYYIASDISAIVPHARSVIYLEDNEMAVISESSYEMFSITTGVPIYHEAQTISVSESQFQKGGFDHFMRKEIHEAPRVVRDASFGKIKKDLTVAIKELEPMEPVLRSIRRIMIVGCGTSYYAGLTGKIFIEKLAKIPVEVSYASEFRYQPIADPDSTLILAISQSGETADTLEAIRHGKDEMIPAIGLVNVVGSTMSREADVALYTNAGPEIAVASTKAFISQLVSLLLFAVHLAKLREEITDDEEKNIVRALKQLPDDMKTVFLQSDHVMHVADVYKSAEHFIYMGRGLGWPTALEGALKLKEISYIHAEGYPAGELKHGPLALISEQVPTLALAPSDGTYEKVLSNIQEVRARGGKIIAVATEGDERITRLADNVIWIPAVHELLIPFLSVLPLQLFAYFIAVARGTNVDQPRNLAKSVTVE